MATGAARAEGCALLEARPTKIARHPRALHAAAAVTGVALFRRAAVAVAATMTSEVHLQVALDSRRRQLGRRRHARLLQVCRRLEPNLLLPRVGEGVLAQQVGDRPLVFGVFHRGGEVEELLHHVHVEKWIATFDAVGTRDKLLLHQEGALRACEASGTPSSNMVREMWCGSGQGAAVVRERSVRAAHHHRMNTTGRRRWRANPQGRRRRSSYVGRPAFRRWHSLR